jgi:hypothetical protein
MTDKGWQNWEIKLKELKHEGHITLGKWNGQWSYMQPRVGWALLFASVTCLQGYIRWGIFVLGDQHLDTSPLGLCRHNKMLLPAKLPQCPISQLEIPATFLGGSSGFAEMVSHHLPCYQGASLRPLGEDPTRHQQEAWSKVGIHPPSELGWRPQNAQQNPVRR